MPAVLLALFALAMIQPGMAYRKWAWEFTDPGRFHGDLNRNFTFGVKALENGYLNLYEDDLRDKPGFGQKLDYTPLRLLTFEAWAAWVWRTQPDVRTCHGNANEYDVVAPLLHYYTALGWLAAVAAMLIVRHWLLVCRRADEPQLGDDVSPWTGVIRAMLAFTLLWFDPGVAIIAHGWPSPNMWVIPLYLWTVLFCLWDRWFIAGVVMGIGALMQGQQMFVMPIFVLWPLFAGQPVRAMRWVCGFAIMFVGFASGWMLSVRPDVQQQVRYVNWTAVVWIVASILLLVLVALHRQIPWKRHRAWWFVPIGVALVVVNLPAWFTGDFETIGIALCVSSLMIAALWWFSWTITRYLLPLATAGLLLACIPFFGASTAWWEVGFLYGAERFRNIGGSLTNNLASILTFTFNWYNIDQHCFTIEPQTFLGWPAQSIDVNIRQVMVSVYVVFFLLAAVAIARQWRRKGPGLLVALVLPWVLFFTLMPQMSPRYAVFAAGIGAICVGRSIGMSLLVLYFSALTVEQTGLCMMSANRGSADGNWFFNRDMYELFQTINHPGPSWATLIAAGVFVWVSLTGVPRRELTPGPAMIWPWNWVRFFKFPRPPEPLPQV